MMITKYITNMIEKGVANKFCPIYPDLRPLYLSRDCIALFIDISIDLQLGRMTHIYVSNRTKIESVFNHICGLKIQRCDYFDNEKSEGTSLFISKGGCFYNDLQLIKLT